MPLVPLVNPCFLCFSNFSKPGIPLFSSEILTSLVDSLYAQAMEAANSCAALSVSTHELTSCCQNQNQSHSQSYITTDGQSTSLSCVRHPFGTCDQIFFLVKIISFVNYRSVDVGRPLWRKVGSVV
jgi:hypothetical protein